MAVFEYKAIAKSGKAVRGIIDADSPAAARRMLREQDLYPTGVVEGFAKEAASSDQRGMAPVSRRDVAITTRQLAVLLDAGTPLVEALGAIIEQVGNARLKKALYDVRAKVNEGSTLADGLGAHPRIFTELYVNMVRAGESSGALEQVLFRLVDILERQIKLKHRIASTLAYPVVMALFGFAIIAFLMGYVVPKIMVIFENQQRALPAITMLLIASCNFIRDRWWVILLLLFGVITAWRAWIARPEGRRQWDHMKLRLPVIGPLYMKIICARLARTLGTMLQSGLTMMTALDVVKTVIQNRVIEETMDAVKSGVRRGRDLAAPLRDTALFPPLLIQMVELGQRSGELEGMLLKIAETYEDDVEMSVDAAVSLLEPFMIIVMGCFVGFLVLSILLPVFDMSAGIRMG
jgi:general secretion pathway protein F